LVLNGTEMSGSIKLTAAYGSGSIALEGSATPAQASGTVVAKGKDGTIFVDLLPSDGLYVSGRATSISSAST
jgi:hypothetical protein